MKVSQRTRIGLEVIMASLLLVLSPVVQGAWIDAPGLLPNGDFEVGTTTNWITQNATIFADNGGNVIKLNTSHTADVWHGRATYEDRIRLHRKLSYVVSFDNKLVADSVYSGHCRLQEYTADTAGTLGFSSTTNIKNTAWNNISIRIGPADDLDADVHYTTGGAWGTHSYLEIFFTAGWHNLWGGYLAEVRVDNVKVDQVPYAGALVDNASGATDVTPNSASLNGMLYHIGESATAVSVHYGTSDGGTNGPWANTITWDAPQSVGPFTTNLTGLTSGTNYYYRFSASNDAGTAWADTSAVFSTYELMVEATDAIARTNSLDTATFTVSRPLAATGTVWVVNYTLGGTATNVTDYTIAPASGFTLAAGQTSSIITVTPVWKYDVEKTVVLTLAPGAAYARGDSKTAICTLLAKDYWPVGGGIIPNGDFEGGTLEHWITSGTSIVADNGGKVMYLTGAYGGPWARYEDRIRLDRAESYIVSFDIKGGSSPSGTYQLSEFAADTGVTAGFVKTKNDINTGTVWTNFSVRIGPARDAEADNHYTTGGSWDALAYSYLELYFNAKSVPVGSGLWSHTGTMRVDNVKVTVVPPRGTVILIL